MEVGMRGLLKQKSLQLLNFLHCSRDHSLLTDSMNDKNPADGE